MSTPPLVIITGDTGILGLQLVNFFLLQKYRVVGISRREYLSENEKYVHVNEDITKEPEKILEKIISQFGLPDTFINNATAFVHKSMENTSLEEYHRIIDVNMTAPFRFNKYLFAQYKKEGFLKNIFFNRSIINVGSISADRTVMGTGEGLLPVYSIAKSGLAALSICAAKEFYELGVRINLLEPSYFLANKKKMIAIVRKCYTLAKSRENGVIVDHTQLQ